MKKSTQAASQNVLLLWLQELEVWGRWPFRFIDQEVFVSGRLFLGKRNGMRQGGLL